MRLTEVKQVCLLQKLANAIQRSQGRMAGKKRKSFPRQLTKRLPQAPATPSLLSSSFSTVARLVSPVVPCWCNDLLNSARSTKSLSKFKSKLKTQLFNEHFQTLPYSSACRDELERPIKPLQKNENQKKQCL